MLSNDTMNALADILSAEPDLAKQIAAIQDEDEARERMRRLAAERGVVWREEPLYRALPDDHLDEVSGGMSDADIMEWERRAYYERLETCRQTFTMMSFMCHDPNPNKPWM
ncbi:hypothetical protein IMZ29_04245 [Achromobacter sp. GG226]|uniref:hypothetical protein n=1 Tax=Verticiella alkaliphila TaxID=2779529 RepID=UPI001C0D9D84|nr:hypothetical protein [Verticiella sp. GG226]MBU4609784.1 hypothetical protein [Verticiella sp. GG226]